MIHQPKQITTAATAELAELCTPKDAARLLEVSPLTVARWTRQLNLATVRTVGGHRRYPKETILRLLHVEAERKSPWFRMGQLFK